MLREPPASQKAEPTGTARDHMSHRHGLAWLLRYAQDNLAHVPSTLQHAKGLIILRLHLEALHWEARGGTLIRSLHQRDRQALAILVQCGGIAHHEEFYQELLISLGGNDREWKKVMATLGDKGLVAASETREGDFFYIVPDPLIAHLVTHLKEDLMLPAFDHEDVRVINPQAFSPPLDFSLVTLSTYIDQHPPRPPSARRSSRSTRMSWTASSPSSGGPTASCSASTSSS